MIQVRITTDNLLEVASQMREWSAQMRGIASDMISKVNSVEGWNDPRAEQFSEQATMTAQQLLLHIDNFTRMSDFLRKYAKMQAEAESAQRSRMNSIR